jgi:hypothetical protein
MDIVSTNILSVFSSNFAEGTSATPATTLLSTSQNTSGKSATEYFEDSDQDDEDFENEDSTMDEDDTQSNTSESFFACLPINPPKNDDSTMQETSSADDQSIAESSMHTPSTRFSITEFITKDTNPQDNSKLRVVVRDTAYSTYRAVLFYVGTFDLVLSMSDSAHSFTPTLSCLLHYHRHLRFKIRHRQLCLLQVCPRMR